MDAPNTVLPENEQPASRCWVFAKIELLFQICEIWYVSRYTFFIVPLRLGGMTEKPSKGLPASRSARQVVAFVQADLKMRLVVLIEEMNKKGPNYINSIKFINL